MDPKVGINSNNNLKYDSLVKDNDADKPKTEKVEESTQQPGQGKIEYFTE